MHDACSTANNGKIWRASQEFSAVGSSWGRAMDRLEWHRGDVLVVGSSSTSSLLQRVFLGSSAAKIVRNSPVPVLVVP